MRIGNKVTVNFERYRRIAMPHIFAHGLNRNILRYKQTLLNPNETIDVNEIVKTDMQNSFDLIEEEGINIKR